MKQNLRVFERLFKKKKGRICFVNSRLWLQNIVRKQNFKKLLSFAVQLLSELEKKTQDLKKRTVKYLLMLELRGHLKIKNMIKVSRAVFKPVHSEYCWRAVECRIFFKFEKRFNFYMLSKRFEKLWMQLARFWRKTKFVSVLKEYLQNTIWNFKC